MTAFNCFSHGTQDLYPTFLQVEHKLSPHAWAHRGDRQNRRDLRRHLLRFAVGALRPAQVHRNRRAAQPAGDSAPGVFGQSGLARRRRVPDAVLRPRPLASCRCISTNCRPTRRARRFPVLCTSSAICWPSVNATLQAGIATTFAANCGLALAVVAGIVAIVIVVLTAIGTEAKGTAFAKAAPAE